MKLFVDVEALQESCCLCFSEQEAAAVRAATEVAAGSNDAACLKRAEDRVLPHSLVSSARLQQVFHAAVLYDSTYVNKCSS